MQFDLPKESSSIIKVIGVGGGGSNAVNHMFQQGIVGVDFAICNTDAQAMEMSEVPIKIQLGPELTEGRGAGSKPEVGREACLESVEEVRRFLSTNTKMVFITAGMGGGTGTGAAPVVAKIAQEMDILTVAIVTTPFLFEGRRRGQYANEGLEELKKHVDTIVVISNDKLRQIHGNLKLSEAFAQADNILTTAAKGIAEIITVPGYVNVDFEDVNTVMRGSGVAIMGTAIAEGENRARRAIDAAMASPLLEDNDIYGAKHILLNVTSGTREVTMDEILEITEFVQNEAGEGTDIIWGNCYDASLGEKLSVTIIATGFDAQQKMRSSAMSAPKQAPKDERVYFSLEDEPEKPKAPKGQDGKGRNYEFEMKQAQQQAEAAATQRPRRPDERQQRLDAIAKRLNSPGDLTELEKVPAYKRQQVQLDDVPPAKEQRMSEWSVSGEGAELRRDNSFLHGNVD